MIARVEAGEISAEEVAAEAPLHQGEAVGVTIILSGNVEEVMDFLQANGGTNLVAGQDYIEGFVPVLLLGRTSDVVFRLAASETSDKWTDLTAPSTPGTYYYGACVDAVSDESDTTNNCSPAVTITVGAALAPDLVVDAPTVSDNAPTAGASFTLSATVRNQGNGDSAFTTLRYYQSSDPTITSGDTEVDTDFVSSLGASGSGDESVSLTAPSTSGTYYYGACVDAVSDESDTTNNCSSAVTVTVGGAPDLVVDTPIANNADLFPGQVLDINVTVRNQGDGPSGTSRVRFYSATDTTISSSDTELLWDWVGQMAAADSRIVGTRLTAPSNSGTYYYGVCVDAVPGESNVTNNCSAALKVTVLARPDMVLDEITVSDTTLRRRFHFTVSATVQNQGGGPSSPVNIHFYHSLDSTITTTDDEVATKWSGTDEISPAGVVTQAVSLAAPGIHRNPYLATRF